MSQDLNPSQRDAVLTASGPLLVLAGAGTGKTRVVTYRIAQLIRRGTPPEKILAVTFTNKAAREMQQRAAALLGRQAGQRPEISTFHSLCVRILRRQIHLLGYPRQFAIYDRSDQEGVARQVLREIRVPSEALRPGDLLYWIGHWKSTGVSVDAAAAQADSDKLHLASVGYRRYQQSLRAAGAVDFDDLLRLTEEVFGQFPDARRTEAARFRQLLVDEYQDTNGSQYRIIKALSAAHRNLCVVGDDDQSIYGWRGAEVQHILRFQHDWPDAKIVRLEENYRSTAEILEVANRLIGFNQNRHAKVLRASRAGGPRPGIMQCQDESDEARRVVADIVLRLREPGSEARDFAILFRTNEQPRPFEMELRRQKLPYVLVGGMSFYDRREVRDTLAYVRLLANPHDEVSLLRIINTPPRGISRPTVTTLLAAAVAQGRALWDILGSVDRRDGVSAAAAAAILRFRNQIEHYRGRIGQQPLVELVRGLIHDVGYHDEIARVYKEQSEQETRWAAVEEVINALAAYVARDRQPSLSEFLDEIALTERDAEDDKDTKLARNAIALMTLHSAKGLEFPQVYLVGMEEGLLPHRRSVEDGMSIDEERRLCYVGVTRAQERLTMSLALQRMKWGKPRPTMPSRFLFEITGQAENPQASAAQAKAALEKRVRESRARPKARATAARRRRT